MTDEMDTQNESPEIPDAKRKNREIVRAWRFDNRRALDEKHEQEAFRRSPAGKLAAYWRRAFEKLPLDERAVIQQQHDRAAGLLRAITSTIDDIANNRIAGETMCYPDMLYAEVKVFLAEFPPITNWMHRVAAAAIPDDLEDCDDVAFRDYGLDTRLPVFIWDEYKRWTLIWCDRNPDLADAEVLSELRATVTSNIYTPVSAPMPGIRQSSRSEELSMQREKQHAELHRRIAEGRRL